MRLELVLTLAALVTVPATADLPATARAGVLQQRVIDLVNQARAQGRRCGNEYFDPTAPMAAADSLARAATRHALDMARRGYFDHRSPEGRQPRDRVRQAGYRPRLTGENIAFGPESAEEVVAGWLASPGHCANIMDPRFREMGVAVAQGRRRGHFYWVQNLGMPAD